MDAVLTSHSEPQMCAWKGFAYTDRVTGNLGKPTKAQELNLLKSKQRWSRRGCCLWVPWANPNPAPESLGLGHPTRCSSALPDKLKAAELKLLHIYNLELLEAVLPPATPYTHSSPSKHVTLCSWAACNHQSTGSGF